MNKITRRDLLEFLLSLSTFLLIAGMIFYYLFIRPYLGFDYVGNSGRVIHVFYRPSPPDQVQLGDQILSVAGDVFEKTPARWDFKPPLFWGYQPGETVDMVVLRAGKEVHIQQKVLEPLTGEILYRINSQWLLPVFFWLAGVMTLLFIRPRTHTTFLMALFFYLTAFWNLVGVVSSGHVFWASLAWRVSTWLTIPVYWHFLWYFPTPLGRLPRWAVWLAYGIGFGLAILQLMMLLPVSLFFTGFGVAIGGSLVLMVLHSAYHRSERKALSLMLLAVGISLVPMMVIGLVGSALPTTFFGVMVVTGFSALPGYFFFTLFQRQITAKAGLVKRLFKFYLGAITLQMLSALAMIWIFQTDQQAELQAIWYLSTFQVVLTMLIGFLPFLILPALSHAEIQLPVEIGKAGENPVRIRANRLAGAVFFFLLLLILASLLHSWMHSWISGSWDTLADPAIVLVFVMASMLGLPAFQNFFQRSVLGMPIHPARLVKTYSEKILTSLDPNHLRRLISEEVLPSLLVRQSALVRLSSTGPAQPFLTYGVNAEDLPTPQQTALLMATAGRMLDHDEFGPFQSWVRLAIPIQMGGYITGLWFFGARDPDDYYDGDDIELLKELAGQTALALVNIEQAENLRALYLADVNRQDSERLGFATELHDDVLNQLAALENGLYALHIPPQLESVFQNTILHLRHVIKDLRPEMLNYGLPFGLQSMVDDLEETLPENGPTILLQLDSNEVRFHPQAELYLFRIIQQACQNALRHSGCSHLMIQGEIRQERVRFSVHDDGHGFDFNGRVTLSWMLAHQHYGLAGMFERAGLIGADLQIHSVVGSGTWIDLNWCPGQV